MFGLVELTLRGGSLDANGTYRSAEAAGRTSLLLEVHDSDVGLWTWLKSLSFLIGVGLLGSTLCLGLIWAFQMTGIIHGNYNLSVWIKF